MIMKARYLIYLLSGLMTFYSCVDDKGSYDYLQTPTVKITFSESIYDGVIGEETHIEPNLSFSEGDDVSNYEFEWELNGEVVCNEQILSFVPKEAITYYVLYSVIHKDSKIRTMKNLQLVAKSSYKTGWAILSDLNHKAILTQVRDDNDEYVDYLNIYEKVNGEELGSQPYKLVEHYSGKKTNPEILVVNQDAKGPLELEGNSMMKVLYTTQEFTEGVPEDFVVTDAAYLYYTDVLLTANGQIYIRLLKNPDNAGFHSAPYSSIPVHYNMGMKITRMVQANFYKTRHVLMYDEKNHRFLSLSSLYSYYTGAIDDVPINGLEGKKLIYADAYLPDPYTDYLCGYVLVLQDADGNYSVKTFDLEYDWQGKVIIKNETDFSFSDGGDYLTDKSKFYCSKDASGSYLFFSGGAINNELYYYEKSTQRVIPYTTCNSEITDLQLNYESMTLGVGMKDGFVVYAVDESTIMGGEAKKLHEVNNIGEVVDVIYRYGSPSKMYR